MAEFRKEYKGCPYCGSPIRLVEEALKPYRGKGVAEDLFAASRRIAMPLKTPTLLTTTMPMLLLEFDHCFDCGREYLVRAHEGNMPYEAKMPLTSS